jgi:8-oxo-dGTP pyrophosphatase MutT (NUDIX family)
VNVAEVAELLRAFPSDGDPASAASVERTLELLERVRDPFSRHQYQPGHVTASALVLSTGRDRVLLVHHGRLARWLQPGGHVEPDDESVRAAARRELHEETGIAVAADAAAPLVAVDVHAIPAARGEPDHFHHDLMFHFTVPVAVAQPGDGADVRWCPVHDLDRWGADGALWRGVARALGRSPGRENS